MNRFRQTTTAAASLLCLFSTDCFAQASQQSISSQCTKRVVLPVDPFVTPGSAMLLTVPPSKNSCNVGNQPGATQYFITVLPPPESDLSSIPTGG